MIYANEFYTCRERIAFAKDKKLNPYGATFDDIEGIPWQGRILCGHNPWLEARLVDNLHVFQESASLKRSASLSRASNRAAA